MLPRPLNRLFLALLPPLLLQRISPIPTHHKPMLRTTILHRLMNLPSRSLILPLQNLPQPPPFLHPHPLIILPIRYTQRLHHTFHILWNPHPRRMCRKRTIHYHPLNPIHPNHSVLRRIMRQPHRIPPSPAKPHNPHLRHRPFPGSRRIFCRPHGPDKPLHPRRDHPLPIPHQKAHQRRDSRNHPPNPLGHL